MKWTIQHNAANRSISIVGEADASGHMVEIEIPERNESDAMHIASSLSIAQAVGRVLVTSVRS